MRLTRQHALAGGGLLLLILLLSATRGGASSDHPDTSDSETQWLCRACHKAFRMTARQADLAMRRSGRLMPVHCRECGELDAWRAARCRVHDQLYLVADAPDSDGLCPFCRPSIVADPANAEIASDAPAGASTAASSKRKGDAAADPASEPAAPSRRRVPAI